MADRLKGKKTLNVTGFLDEFEKDDVKKNIDIINLFEHFNIKLSRKGKNHIGLCPWHKDSNPSLSVDRAKGLYNCFGCGESGDIFTLVEKMKGYSFKEALDFLKTYSRKQPLKIIPLNAKDKREVNITDEKERETGQEKAVTSFDKEAKDKAKTDTEKNRNYKDNEEEAFEETETSQSKILNIVTDYYHKRLLENKAALNYLKMRGLKKPSLLSRFKIGFCDGTILDKVSTKDKKKLTGIGILNENSREHFLNCLSFPIMDDNENTIGIYGRASTSSAAVKHLYLKGKHLGVFNRKVSKIYDSIILTESIIDALSLIEAGFDNTQALYGTNGLTDFHLKRLKEDRVKEIIIALDNDDAGQKASEKLKERLVAEDFDVKIIYPDNKDWNEDLTSALSSPPLGDLGGVEKDSPKILKTVVENKIKNAQTFTNPHKKTQPAVTKEHGNYIFSINEITYRVSGVKDIFVNNLRVNIKARDTEQDLRYYDNLDLYSARSRNTFSHNLSREFDIEQKQIEKDLFTILEYLEKERDRALEAAGSREEKHEMTEEEIKLGLEFLQAPNLLELVVTDMEILGYVGEKINKQLMFVSACSRKLDDPISTMVISQSAGGKTKLVETTEEMLPPEDVISVTSLSDQALNYVKDMDHKFLVLGESVHGVEVEHQLREIQASHRLRRGVVVQDPKTGKNETEFITTRAVVACALTGTSRDINPENASRNFIIEVDESAEQTARVHEKQQSKYSFERQELKATIIPDMIKAYHAAGRLLRKVFIVNDFAKSLRFPTNLMRTRRDHERFIDLIASICFVRQYQKKHYIRNNLEYIKCDLTDYKYAYEIIMKILSSTLFELTSGTIDFYEKLRDLSRKLARKKNLEASDVSITQRDMREYTGFGHEWVKKQFRILVEYEYALLARGGKARVKAFYRIREDKPINKVDLSMIPAPDEMAVIIDKSNDNSDEKYLLKSG